MLSFAAFCRHLASSDPASTPSSPTSLMMPVITSSSRRSTLRPTFRPSSPPSTTIDASTRNSPRQPPSCTRVTLRYRRPSLFPFPCNVPPATPLPTSCNSPMRHVHPTYVQGHHQHATDLTKSRLAHYATAPLTLPPPRRQPPSICRRPARRCHTSPACRRPTCCRRTYRRQARHHRLCLPAVAVPAAAQLAVIVYSRTSRRPTCRRRCVPA